MLLAQFVLYFLWPLVTIILFQRFNLQAAIICAIVGGYLLVPTRVGHNLPLLPSLNKDTVPAFLAALMAIIMLKQQQMASYKPNLKLPFNTIKMPVLPGWLPKSLIGRGLLLMIIVGAVGTVVTNGDGQVAGGQRLRALQPYDAFNIILTILAAIVPFFLARKFLGSAQAHLVLLTLLVIAGLAYSLLVLYEVRMSPRLNLQIYGFRPKSWVQSLRGGGFRPTVFLENGLYVTMFIGCMSLAAFGAMRASTGARRIQFLLAGLWLLAVLTVSNSLGALLITVVCLPVLFLLGSRGQLLFAGAIAGAVLTYPMLRSADLVPTQGILSIIERVDPNRVGSLRFRFENEDILLDRAKQRPIFGWGGWNRSRVFDERGRDISVTDGRWIIVMGQNGWVGYIGQYGLLTLPIILLAIRQRRFEPSMATAGLCVVTAANLVDSLPNGGINTVTWLMAGALMGRLELPARSSATDEAPVEVQNRRAVAYSRPPPAVGPAYSRRTPQPQRTRKSES